MFSNKTKILIADDMLTMRKIVKSALTTMGFSNFVVAFDGKNAWEQLNEEDHVGLIISDWNMPNMTGLDLLANVRQTEQYKHIPFILLTAESDVAQVQEAIKAGVDNYVVKPFTPASLNEKIAATYDRCKSRVPA